MAQPILHWFRRDLRLFDNSALTDACARAAGQVIPVFVVDPTLVQSKRVGAPRLAFLHHRLTTLHAELQAAGSGLVILYGDPRTVIPAYAQTHGVQAVSWQSDPTPWGNARDQSVTAALARMGISVHTCDTQILVPVDRIRSGTGTPYTVFTPFYRRWRAELRLADPLPTPQFVATPLTRTYPVFPTWPASPIAIPDTSAVYAARLLDRFGQRAIAQYSSGRDMLAQAGTSMLSPYLRFGIVSVQSCTRLAWQADTQATPSDSRSGGEVWLSELAWRDFYTHISAHFPHVLNGAFRPQYDGITWENDPALFEAWCTGTTGYPIVDAAMRQLVSTGWMHNRARMVTSSFLTKDLLIDWRWGEQFFMQYLLDGDTASNNGGWQWAAGTGTDAQPYFRIFNPSSQGERFDPDGAYVKKYIPALINVPAKYIHAPWNMPVALQRSCGCIIGEDYPAPIVDHATQRVRALELYKAVRAAATDTQT